MRRPGLGGPGNARQPAFNVPPVTLAMTAAIVLVWLAIQVLPASVWQPIAEVLILVPARFRAAYESGDPGALAGELPTLVTYAVLHVQALHLFANAGFLLAFGSQCERQMGWGRYLAMTAVAAAAGGVAELIALGDAAVPVLGASAATSGMMGAFAWTLLTATDPQRRRVGIGLIAAFIGINALFGVMGGALMGVGAGVAWQAHIGGFAAGMVFGVTDPVRRMVNRGRGRG